MKTKSAIEKGNVEKKFVKYVSQNILGMLGMSAYILADTFFISQAEGARGITALNLVLPVYSLIFAIGSMVAVGAATKFSIQRARKEADAEDYFPNAIIFTLLVSVIFMLAGFFGAEELVAFLGGDEVIVAVGAPYTRIFLMFTPMFMWNYIFNAFVRNDKDPSLAMMATLSSSIFNIVMDYVLMFPLRLGMAGAALATAFSPVVGILVCSIHFLTKKNTIHFRLMVPSVKKLLQSCQLGVAAFVGEISSGVTTIVFNFLILKIAGNEGVAAYGIVANTAIVATAFYNGVSQGSQPLISDYHGKGDHKAVRKTLKLAVVTSLILSVIIILLTNVWADVIVEIFNSERNQQLAVYAVEGVKLYFVGFLFAGFNIVGAGYLSAAEAAGWAFVTSILRGFVAIIICAFVFAMLWGMTGVWLAFAAAELVTAVVMVVAIFKSKA